MQSFKTTLIALAILFFSAGAFAQITIPVTTAAGLNAAIDFANNNPGSADILELVDAGQVYELAPAEILYPITITGTDLNNPPIIKAAAGIAQNDYITVVENLTVNGVVIDGQTQSGDYAHYKYMFKVNNPPGTTSNDAPELVVTNCTLRNVYANGDPVLDTDGNVFDISTGSYAAKVHFTNTTIENTGDEGVRSINAHKDPVHPNGTAIGSLVIRNCTFNNINGSAIKVESDGDSTTYDGELTIENVTFYNCARRVIWERDYAGSVMKNLIIAGSKKGNDDGFVNTDALISIQREGSIVASIDTFDIQGVRANGDTVKLGLRTFVPEGGSWSNSKQTGDVEWTAIYDKDPMFADAANGDFTLLAGSPCYRMSAEGTAIGDLRWATNPPPPPTKISVSVNDGLNAAIDFANGNPGSADIIELSTPNGEYNLLPVNIDVPLTIISADAANPAVIKADATIDQDNFIRVRDDLEVRNVIIDGQAIGGSYARFKFMFKVGNAVASGFNDAPRLRVINSTLRNVYRNGDPVLDVDGTIFDVSTSNWVGAAHFEKVTFRNTGDEAIRSINAHKSPVHPLNGAIGALIVRDCTFDNIKGSAIKIESDGDSLTADSPVLLENLTFYNCARRVIWERDHMFTQIRNLIISDSQKGNDDGFAGTDALISFQRFGSFVSHVDTFNVSGIRANGDTVVIGATAFINEGGTWSNSHDVGIVKESTIYNLDPQYADPSTGNFQPLNGALATLSHSGGLIGDRHFGVQTVGIVDDTRLSPIPRAFSLEQNYPNPFNPSTTIRYSLQARAHITLQIFNILGEQVETLLDEARPAGDYSITWDASRLSTGVYFYRLSSGSKVQVRKMMLVK